MIEMYKKKIEIILDNRLEYNGDNDKEIEIVHHWLTCEWQGSEMNMSDYLLLSKYIDEVAKEKIKNF